MRVSTVAIFEQSMSLINRQHEAFLKVSTQLGSGRRVTSPSDDPQAASRAQQVEQAMGVIDQLASARVSARNSLLQEDSVLQSVVDAVTSAKTLLLQAANGTLDDSDRASIAEKLEGVYETLIGQANATDGSGVYLFGGYQDDSAPFVRTPEGAITYVGGENNREMWIDASRSLPVGNNGREIFLTVQASAGYLAVADPANTGSITFDGPNVIDSQHPDYGSKFTVSFDLKDGVATMAVERDGSPLVGMEALEYQSGQPIEFGGLIITFEGEPKPGDRITVELASERDPNLFATLERALAALNKPVESPSDRAALINTLNTSMRELDDSLDNVLSIGASVGARLNELDIVDSIAENRLLHHKKTLSDLVDLNYVEAISEYTLRQIGLSAAQKTFVEMKSMSLFNFL